MIVQHSQTSTLALALSIAATWSGTALAQVAVPAKSGTEGAAAEVAAESGEIIVTAQRRSQSLQKVPVAVSAITSATLQQTGVSSTDQLLAISPGLSFTRQLSGATPYIRGVGTQAVTAGNEAAVAMYVDGVYYQSPYANVFSFNNIEQVEVLRGPQGTLFGRNATGGLINVRTREPQSDLTVKGSVSYGNYNTVEASAYVSGGSDVVAMDIAAQITHQSDGYGRNLLTGVDVNFRRDKGIRSKIKITPTDDLKIVLSGDYTRIESDLGVVNQPRPNTAVVSRGGGFYDSIANLSERNKTDWYGGSLVVEYNLGDTLLKSTTAYRKLSLDIIYDQDVTPTRIVDILLTQKDHSFQQEIILQGELGSVNYTAGVFYFSGEGAYYPLRVRSDVQAAQNFDLYSPLGVKSLSAFAQADIKLGSATTFTIGGRYTTDTRENAPTLVKPGGSLTNPADIVRSFAPVEKTFGKVTWRFALAHEITNDMMVFASYNRGFKSGVYSTSTPGSPPVAPEVLDAFEGGLRSEWLDRSLRFNLTGYYYKYSNIQLTATANGATQLYNAAKGTSYGFEAETNYVAHLGEGKFDFTANLSYVHAKYDEFPNGVIYMPGGPGGTNIRSLGDLSGKEFIHAPRFSYTLAANYSVPVGNGAEFGVGGTLFHSDSFFWEPANRLKQPAVDLVSAQASLSFNDGKYRVRIFGKNLVNEKYFSYAAETILGDKAGPADPRTFGIGLDVSF